MSGYESFRDEAEAIASRQIRNGRWNDEVMEAVREELAESPDAEAALLELILAARYDGQISTDALVRALEPVVSRVESRVSDSIEIDLKREADEAVLDRKLER